jgi:hypothetical protein
MKGFTAEEQVHGPQSVACKYKVADANYVALDFTCNDNMKAARQATIDQLKKGGMKVEELAIGAGAIRLGSVIQVWDDDTNCHMTIGALGNDVQKDGAAFAKELAAAITPASL